LPRTKFPANISPMRDQFLIITTILVVGTASASAYAFYSSPNKLIALLGKPPTSTPSKSSVAGVSTQKETPAVIPTNIPLPSHCDVLSYLKTFQNYQIVCQTKDSLFVTTKNYGDLLSSLGWESTSALLKEEVFKITAQKGSDRINIKIFTNDASQTLVSIDYFPH